MFHPSGFHRRVQPLLSALPRLRRPATGRMKQGESWNIGRLGHEKILQAFIQPFRACLAKDRFGLRSRLENRALIGNSRSNEGIPACRDWIVPYPGGLFDTSKYKHLRSGKTAKPSAENSVASILETMEGDRQRRQPTEYPSPDFAHSLVPG